MSDSEGPRTQKSKSNRKAILTIVALGLGIFWLGGKSLLKSNENDVSRPTLNAQVNPPPPTATPLPPHFPADSSETAPIPPDQSSDQSLLAALERCWTDRQLNDLNAFDQFTVLDLEKVFGRISKQELIQQKEELELTNGLRRSIELRTIDDEAKTEVFDIDSDGVPTLVASVAASKAGASEFKKWRKDSKTTRIEKNVGLLFDKSLFKGGAAGTAREVDGLIKEFQVRADGRILRCGSNGTCDCN